MGKTEKDEINCKLPLISPGARFSKALKTSRARKAICSSSVSNNGEVYAPETSCIKGALFILRICYKNSCAVIVTFEILLYSFS